MSTGLWKRKVPAKPSRRAVQAAIAAQSPPGWIAPEKPKRRKWVEDADLNLDPKDDTPCSK